ncbi:DUF2938 domain-containing protein [Flavivirga jejuensis]|uniref:DUF2938 domain-containing protein n=1 Tax=Flavivirga jejuensis TaxID=870487 RepID=A0ABT8WIM3_9FLAO|nr:DUF2938 domain-containing protein [Flavivirga jejuensis]MDO5972982.1 DUF2938 domain-containing protein [Flavivirga jejuensis]
MNILLKVFLTGIGATLAMDLWGYILSFFHIKSLNYAFVGRWIGHMFNGQFYHDKIMNATPIKNELLLGWISHYAIGITFAFLMFAIYGKGWFDKPTLFPALVIGLATIVAPFFIMQPAFGFGVACSNLPDPNTVRLKSFMAHFIYGIGLYLCTVLIKYTFKN